MQLISLEPIGYIESSYIEKADSQRQGTLSQDEAYIHLLPGKNFEQALEDLSFMERIWILSWLDKARGWKSKVQPPRAGSKKGVFATRSPHRPNPIGLSCVRLLSVEGRRLHITEHDLLNGTPVLDIKPYIVYADSFPNTHMGWIGDLQQKNNVAWEERARFEIDAIREKFGVNLKEKVEVRLAFFEKPTSSNRVRLLEEGFYLQAYQYWRVLFSKKGNYIQILQVTDSRNV